MNNWIDLHCHYLPEVDDGVMSFNDGCELLRGLHEVGFSKVMATPHVGRAMWKDNRRSFLTPHFENFAKSIDGHPGMPQISLGAEHYFDETFFELLKENELLPYDGSDRALLIEFPYDSIPVNAERELFSLSVRGFTPLIAHPERYFPLYNSSRGAETLARMQIGMVLDLMSLIGKYGRKPKKAAERMLDEGFYFAACSDAHRPSDVSLVAKSVECLYKRVGAGEAHQLLCAGPQTIFLKPVADPSVLSEGLSAELSEGLSKRNLDFASAQETSFQSERHGVQ